MVQANRKQNNKLNTAISLLREKNFIEAAKALDEVLRYSPINADALYLKAVIANEHNNLVDAEILLKEALKASPKHFPALLDLSSIQIKLEAFDDARITSLKALRINPNNVEALFNLGNAYIRLEQLKEGIDVLQKVIKIYPEHDLALYLISMAYFKDEQAVEGAKYAIRTLKLNPHLPYIRIMLSDYYGRNECKYSIAIKILEDEIILDPKSDKAYRFIASHYAKIGEIERAIELTKMQIKVTPDCPFAHGNLIVFLPYSPHSTNEDILNAARDYYQKCFIEKGIEGNKNFPLISKTTDRPLRVGFVSGDFRKHALFFWLKGLFSRLKEKNIDVYCYCNNDEDDFSKTWKAEVDHWTNIKKINDREAFTKIYEDQIDILIDLSGHTEHNRLGVFALKPAPVQATWLGQAGPMGLPQLDYMLTDSYFVNPGEEKNYIEKIYRLPGVYAPYGTGVTEELTPPPCVTNGYVTFGCFNNFVKVNKEVLSAWIKILKQVPDSRLFLKSHLFADENVQINIKNFFADNGIHSERLILEGFDPDRDIYMKKYQSIDIALDPFPIGGGTTTNDLVSMGIPLISLYGKRCSHRSSAGILHHMGCDELIAHSIEEYVSKAVDLAGNFERIQKYRLELRDLYLNSPFLDLDRFAEDFSNSLKNIWQVYCKGE